MFQQAYNKLKQENDDRQKIIRCIRDNPIERIELECWHGETVKEIKRGREKGDSCGWYEHYYDKYDIDSLDDNDILHPSIYVTCVFNMDFCYIIIDDIWQHYAYIICTRKTTTVTDMWLEHRSKCIHMICTFLNYGDLHIREDYYFTDPLFNESFTSDDRAKVRGIISEKIDIDEFLILSGLKHRDNEYIDNIHCGLSAIKRPSNSGYTIYDKYTPIN